MISMPIDANSRVMQLTPSCVALAQTVDATISASTEITFNTSSTFLRVYAISQDIYMKWGTADVTSSNFDEIIPSGQIVDFVIPRQTTGILYTAANFIERAASATLVVIEK